MYSLNALSTLTAAVVVAALPVIPPEHVHTPHGPSANNVTTHRHLDPHLLGHRHEAFTTLDDVDDAVVTLEPLFTASARVSFAEPALVANVIPAAPVFVPSGSPPQELSSGPIHGPPRGSSALRAPPAAACL